MIHDIAHCEGGGCPLKDKCYRFLAHQEAVERHLKYMTYITTPPHVEDKCDAYIPINKE